MYCDFYVVTTSKTPATFVNALVHEIEHNGAEYGGKEPIHTVSFGGGTSRGPYINRTHLPQEREQLAEVLIAMVGSGHPLNIDGIGGGDAVTTKVAMLSPSSDPWADVDYFFAQVSVETKLVDFKPTCGNILVCVGPAAIEMGMVEATAPTTEVKIRAVNTGARVLAKVTTDGASVIYEGTAAIDGVPGTAAPVELQFMDVEGGATGALFPTGNRIDVIDGVSVTCLDVAPAKIEKLNNGISPIYAPGLDELIERNHKAGRLHFTTDKAEAYTNAEMIFICVGTPSDEMGHADLKYVLAAASDIGKAIEAAPGATGGELDERRVHVTVRIEIGVTDDEREAISISQTVVVVLQLFLAPLATDGNAGHA